MEQWKEIKQINMETSFQKMVYCYQTKMLACINHDGDYLHNITLWTWNSTFDNSLTKLDCIEKLNQIRSYSNDLNIIFNFNGENLIIYSHDEDFFAIYNFANDTITTPNLPDFYENTENSDIINTDMVSRLWFGKGSTVDTDHPPKTSKIRGINVVSYPKKNVIYLHYYNWDHIVIYDMDEHKIIKEYEFIYPSIDRQFVHSIYRGTFFDDKGIYYVCLLDGCYIHSTIICMYNATNGDYVKTFRLNTEQHDGITIKKIYSVNFLMNDKYIMANCELENYQYRDWYKGNIIVWDIDNGNYQIKDNPTIYCPSPSSLLVSPFTNTFFLMCEYNMLDIYNFSSLKNTTRCCLGRLDKSITPDVNKIRTALFDKCKIPTEMINKIIDESGVNIQIGKIQTLKRNIKRHNKRSKFDGSNAFFLDDKHVAISGCDNTNIYEKSIVPKTILQRLSDTVKKLIK
jgi:hypothetical protein